MAANALTHIKKRDGRVVPFDGAKLAASVRAAAAAVGAGDTVFAQEIAEAIALHFSHAAGEPPTTETIAEAIERVLVETRHHATAHAYRAFRADREAGRARCQVVKPLQASLIDAEAAVLVSFDRGQRAAAWDRSRIVQALEREARISRSVAEDVARAVEAKLFGSDLRSVTTTLIRALTDNELLARGYTSALRQQSSITIPFDDITRLLQQDAAAAAATLGKQAILPYTLTRVYSDDVATAHQRGMFTIGGLTHPQAIYRELARLTNTSAAPRALRAEWERCWSRLRCGQLERVALEVDLAADDGRVAAQFGEWCDYAAALPGEARIRALCPAGSCGAVMQALAHAPAVRAMELLFTGEGAREEG